VIARTVKIIVIGPVIKTLVVPFRSVIRMIVVH